MKSILNEISKLRKGTALVIDHQNSNRYRVVAVETDGSKTAYYFTAPIYNTRTRKAVDMKFYTKGETICSTGSNANITITENIRIENTEGSCVIALGKHSSLVSDCEVSYGKERMYPTTNGVAIRSICENGHPYTFSIEVSKPFPEVRANDKYFALMSERFRPFLAISCIGTANIDGNIISPAKLSYQKNTDNKYTLSIDPCSPLGQSVFIEVNLYDPKLFQDTTVESKNSKTNNAFGGIGFIGTTKEFGEQWLYSRPDFSRMTELNNRKLLRAILHIPRFNNDSVNLSISKVSARFCSFGSTWNNKVAGTPSLANSQIADDYIDFDFMPVLSDDRGRLLKGEGFILKPKLKDAGFSVIATADSYIAPQILEINYI